MSAQEHIPASASLIIRPGDTLVLGFNRQVDDDETEQIRTQIRERLPGIQTVVIEQVTHIAAYRPDGA